jgi:hypothetical protein
MELLDTLRARCEELAPHYSKHFEVLESILPSLERTLEAKGLRELVHIDQTAPRPREEMRVIQHASADRQETLRFLGCYYGLQLLHLNAGELSVLSKALASGAPRSLSYRRFMMEVGTRFRRLSASYMDRLLSEFLSRRRHPPFVLASVGTRSDQDDIDTAIVDGSPEHRANLNAAVARLAREMMRYATPLHCHLAERLGTGNYSAAVDEYRELLDRSPHDFVTISELLGATRVVGDTGLLEQFTDRVTERYFFRRGADNRFHEAYLRGILGEIRSLLARPPAEDILNPKDDALRLVKGMLWAFKTMRSVRRNNAWHILDALKKDLPRDRAEWDRLEGCLSYLETFRFVYHLRVSESERIWLGDEASRANLSRVADVLEFKGRGVVTGTQWMLVHYYDSVAAARAIVARLLPKVRTHLTRHSLFRPVLREAKRGRADRLATDLVERFHFFRGTTYFEGVLDSLRTPALSSAFISSMRDLPPEEQQRVAHKYGEWGAYDPGSFLSLLEATAAAPAVVELLNSYFLGALEHVPDAPERLASLPRLTPIALATYLEKLDERGVARWSELAARIRYEQTGDRALKETLRFHSECSRHCRELLTGLARRYPQLLASLDRPDTLRALSDGLLKERELAETLEDRRQRLLDYFGLEELRAGLLLLGGDHSRRVFEQATRAVEIVLASFLEVAREAYDRLRGGTVPTGGTLALLVAGGHAREQVFNDECDLIVLLDSEDPDLLDYAGGVIAHLNAELTRCGLIPHHYFAPTVGRYVVLLTELDRILAQTAPETLVQKCQILGSRVVAGERWLGRKLVERILEPHMFRDSAHFLEAIHKELDERGDVAWSPPDLKHNPGGMRDIELAALMAKAHFRLTVPLGSDLFRLLGRIDPAGRELYVEVGGHFDFLRLLRELYRLTAGRSDQLWEESLAPCAALLDRQPAELLETVRKRLVDSRASVLRVARHLLSRAGPRD